MLKGLTKKSKFITIIALLAILLVSIPLILQAKKTNGFSEFPNMAPFISDEQFKTEGLKKETCKIEDEFTFSYSNNDGSETKYLFSAPVAYKNSEQNLIPIDNRIISTVNEEEIIQGYAFKNAANIIDILYPKELTNEKGVMVKSADTSMEVIPVLNNDTSAAKNKVKDFMNYNCDAIVYDNAFGKETSFECINTIFGFQGNIVLNKFTDKNEFKFILKIPNVETSETNDFYTIFKSDAGKKNKVIIYPPFAKDSYFTEGSEYTKHISNNNQLSLQIIDQDKGIYSLTVLVDRVFLEDKNTVYPVIINPSFYLYKNKEPDSTVYSDFGKNQYLSNYSGIGKNDYFGAGRTYVRFDSLKNDTYLPDKIKSAFYNTYNLTSNKNLNLQLFEMDKKWCSFGLTWSTQKKWGPIVGSAGSGEQGMYTFDITSLMKKWMLFNRGIKSGVDPENGFLLKESNENKNWQLLSSSDNGYRIPYLKINILK